MKVAPGCHSCESSLSHVLFQNAHSPPVDVTNLCYLLLLSLCQHGEPVPKQGDFCSSIWWLTLRAAVGTAILVGRGRISQITRSQEGGSAPGGFERLPRIMKCGAGLGPICLRPSP